LPGISRLRLDIQWTAAIRARTARYALRPRDRGQKVQDAYI
jgi:hypothetical protein